MHHFTQLRGNQAIQLGNARIQRGGEIGGYNDFAFQNLVDQLTDNVARAVLFQIGMGNTAFFNDLVEQIGIFNRLRNSSCRGTIHLAPPSFCSPNCCNCSVLFSTSFNKSSSFSLPASLLRRSASLERTSCSLRNGSTCCTTASGRKSSNLLNSKSIPSSPPCSFKTFLPREAARRF